MTILDSLYGFMQHNLKMDVNFYMLHMLAVDEIAERSANRAHRIHIVRLEAL